MTLPNWENLPIKTKRSRKRWYGVIAAEYSLTAWKSLPIKVKRSKKKLYNYIASQKNLEEYDELAKLNMMSARLLYNYIKENASSSKPTLKIKVKDGDDNLSGASVTIGSTTETTNASGEASFSLDYDNYTFTVEATGFEDYEEFIKFRANHKTFTAPVTAILSKVTVTAKDGSDNKLEDASVYLFLDAVPIDVGTTDKDGVCIFEDIRFGTYTLAAVSEDEALTYTGSLTVDGDETTTITLTAPTGTVTVTCDDGTDPVASATVTLKQDNETIKTGTTSELGVCALENVPYGTYTLEASKETVGEYSGTLTVDGDETVTITLTPVEEETPEEPGENESEGGNE